MSDPMLGEHPGHELESRPILRLSDSVANQIAAGEVVERPASVVKELVENSVDAGARRIVVSVREGGLAEIQVTDDGRGIPADQVSVAFERHATSKIRTGDDLFAIGSLGFRGEALPSIASVAYITMRSKRVGVRLGTEIRLEGGRRVALEPKGMPDGTTVVVSRLFYNTPARRKFLKSESAERRAITELITKLALAHPDIQFVYEAEGREVLRTPGDGELLSAAAALYGHPLARTLLSVSREAPFGHVEGLVAPPSEAKGNRGHLSIFVNGRWIESRSLATAVERGYANLLPSRRYPVAVIKLSVEPSLVDVNVHPAKTEVRFRDDRMVFSAVMHAVREALLTANLIGGPGPVTGAVPTATVLPPQPAEQRLDLFPRRKHEPVEETPTVVWRPAPPAPDMGAAEASATVDVPSVDTSQLYEVDMTTGEVRERRREAVAAGPRHWVDPVRHTHAEQTLPPGPATADEARECLSQAKVLGQVLNTYMIVPVPWGLWLVDQHVAHERILFEKALQCDAGEVTTQPLLVPLTLDVSLQVHACLDELGEELTRMGFVYEPFGGTSLLIRAVPTEFSDRTDAVAEIFEELAELYVDGRPEARRERIAAMVACKGAVKAGQRLPIEVMEELLKRLAMCENPFACPHGRPIVIEIGQAELERRFGRR